MYTRFTEATVTALALAILAFAGVSDLGFVQPAGDRWEVDCNDSGSRNVNMHIAQSFPDSLKTRLETAYDYAKDTWNSFNPHYSLVGIRGRPLRGNARQAGV